MRDHAAFAPSEARQLRKLFRMASSSRSGGFGRPRQGQCFSALKIESSFPSCSARRASRHQGPSASPSVHWSTTGTNSPNSTTIAGHPDNLGFDHLRSGELGVLLWPVTTVSLARKSTRRNNESGRHSKITAAHRIDKVGREVEVANHQRCALIRMALIKKTKHRRSTFAIGQPTSGTQRGHQRCRMATPGMTLLFLLARAREDACQAPKQGNENDKRLVRANSSLPASSIGEMSSKWPTTARQYRLRHRGW